jgi:hypothetical protein
VKKHPDMKYPSRYGYGTERPLAKKITRFTVALTVAYMVAAAIVAYLGMGGFRI